MECEGVAEKGIRESSLFKKPIPPKVEDPGLRRFSPASTPLARKLEGVPFRAPIGDRQAVYWWLLGHELSFQAKSLAWGQLGSIYGRRGPRTADGRTDGLLPEERCRQLQACRRGRDALRVYPLPR